MGVFQIPIYEASDEDPDYDLDEDFSDYPGFEGVEGGIIEMEPTPYKNQPGETPIKIVNPAEIKERLLAVEAASKKKQEAVKELDQAIKQARLVLGAYKGYAIQLDDDTIIQVNTGGFGNGGLYTKLKVVKL